MSAVSFSLLTINSWKCDGAYAQRMGLLAQGLTDLAPDVVALQEAFMTEDGSVDTARRLATATGLRALQAPARPRLRRLEGRELASFSGQAVLTRLEVQHAQSLSLPSSDADGGRVAQVVELWVDGHRITVANVHLSHLRGEPGDALRERQLRAVLDHLDQIGPRGLTVLCGDFNAPLTSPALSAFLGAPWHLQDSFSLVGEAREPTHVDPSGHGQVLDHVLIAPALGSARVEVTAAATVLRADRPDARGIAPSDHSALRVGFRLTTA